MDRLMSRSIEEFERVFGPESTGDTDDDRASSSRRIFVRSQLQIAEDMIERPVND
jgi:hypothetical protein